MSEVPLYALRVADQGVTVSIAFRESGLGVRA